MTVSHPNCKANIRWNCCAWSPQFEMQNTYQVQTPMTIGPRLLSRFMNLKQTFWWITSVSKVPSQTFPIGGVCVSATAVPTGLAPFTFSSSTLLRISWLLQFPPAVSEPACSPRGKCSLRLCYYSLQTFLVTCSVSCYFSCVIKNWLRAVCQLAFVCQHIHQHPKSDGERQRMKC